MLVICPLCLFFSVDLAFAMRQFWLCFTSIPFPVCLCVCRIGIPTYSAFLWRNWLPLMGQGKKPLKALTFLLFQSPYLFRSPPTLCFCLLVLSSSYSISLSKFLSYSFFSCWFLLSFLMGIKKSSSYASVYSDQVEYTHRHTQLKHLPSIT